MNVNDRCLPNPCKNRGTCYFESTKTRQPGLKCNCHGAYRGTYCQKKTPVCSALKCGNIKACFASPAGTLCLCEGTPPIKYLACLADKSLSDFAQVGAMVTRKMANSALIVIILAVISVVSAIGFALLYRKATAKLQELESMYQDAEDHGYTPVARLPTISEAIHDVLKTTFCCAKSAFPSSCRPLDVPFSCHPHDPSRNCNAVKQKMWPAPYMESNGCRSLTQSSTRDNKNKKWKRRYHVADSSTETAYTQYGRSIAVCHRDHTHDDKTRHEHLYSSPNANAQRKHKRNMYKTRVENACNSYHTENVFEGTKHDKRKCTKKYSSNVNMKNDLGVANNYWSLAESYCCKNMPFLKYGHTQNINTKCFNTGRQQLVEENMTRRVPYQHMKHKETPPRKDPLKRANNIDERNNIARGSTDNSGVVPRREKTPSATLKDTHNPNLLKVDANKRNNPDSSTPLGGIWVTTVTALDERSEEQIVIDLTGDDDFMNGVQNFEDHSEQSEESVSKTLNQSAVDIDRTN
ncbi:uncharacterized protein LOC127859443 isoform X2 [Dreissena polymorpha]|uniref:uncharacterized protein LOC127859443 isoform X2 n=1 Tax=Dreissena polymorpha TaxID=45954 RepID=UPI0022644CEE|nr:uncharacterized protein LOC127859443 isoform X2 [Dreissena polymorpha]